MATVLAPSQIRTLCYQARLSRELLYKRATDVYDWTRDLVAELPSLTGSRLHVSGHLNVKCGYVDLDAFVGVLSGGKGWLEHIEEIVLDATHKTNGTRQGNMNGTNPQFELYVIMATFRGEGYPVSYMCLQENDTEHLQVAFIAAWLSALRSNYKLSPKWVHLDKCAAEIGAVKATWGTTVKLSLCLWHLDQSIRRRIADPSLPRLDREADMILSMYPIEQAEREFVPATNITPTGDTVSRVTIRTGVCDLMREHYNHPYNWFSSGGTLQDKAKAIYTFCLTEMYEYCLKLGLRYLWLYLYRNWYGTPYKEY
ncbi:hypothetical protein ACHHYP_13828 [Achlya hypogyna]|uniref:Uncharacterized protein n=1 Tax=Achlya hypogyna TaxID=1202772 RepID=A0A1V9ZFC4_ACHHY|nr:hypothetical protein ACHHYP_13828 [Achlya hypogyna]